SGTCAPAATIASSAGTAKAGVPANAIRAAVTPPSMDADPLGSERRAGAGRHRFALASGSFQIAFLDALALELREVVDEQLAFEMIHLVLDALREQTFRLELERLAVAVERLHLDALGPLDVVVQPGHGQAPLLEAPAAFGRDNFRIDQAIRLIAPFGHVHHDDPLVNVDLGRGEADPGRRVHRLEHVVHEAPDVVVDNCDALGAYSQPRVGILENWESCHCGRPSVSCITLRTLR